MWSTICEERTFEKAYAGTFWFIIKTFGQQFRIKERETACVDTFLFNTNILLLITFYNERALKLICVAPLL